MNPPLAIPTMAFRLVPVDLEHLEQQEEALNALGAQGYQLASVLGADSDAPVLLMARPTGAVPLDEGRVQGVSMGSRLV